MTVAVGALIPGTLVATVVCLACQAALGAFAGDAAAMTIVVPASTSDSAASCSSSPCPNLRSAVRLANANPGSTIRLEAGDYWLTMGQLLVTAGMTITGQGPTVSRVQQLGAGRVFNTSGSADVTLADLEVTGGNDNEQSGMEGVGGGVASFSSGTLVLRHALVDNNSVQGGIGLIPSGTGGEGAGAGVFVSDGALVLDHTTVSNNTAGGGNGGAGLSGQAGTGGAVFGAGVDSEGTMIRIEDSSIVANVGVGGQGGIGNTLGGTGGEVDGAGVDVAGTTEALISHSTVADNLGIGGAGGPAQSLGGNGGDASTAYGGGLLMREGALENSTITENRTSSGAVGTGLNSNGAALTPFGGGLDVTPGPGIALISDTFGGNVASPAGGGNGGNIATSAGAQVTLFDTIVARGVAANGADCIGTVSDGGHNLEDGAASQCGLSAAKHDLIGVDPQLASLEDNGGPTRTLALRAGSPAIDAGPSAGCAMTDQRGEPRPDKGERRCDIGAYEFQDKPPYHSVITGQKINKKTGTATFRFSATGATGFQCALIVAKRSPTAPRFIRCRPPRTYRHLKRGRYIFEVRGVNFAGPDPRPAIRKFVI